MSVRRTRDNNRDLAAITASAISHLARAGHLREHVLKTPRLQRLQLQATFMTLHQPRAVFATVQTLIDSLHSGMLRTKRRQFPVYNLFRLATLCRKARYAFIGDAKQLAPYADVDLLRDLRQWAVGDLLGVLANKAPHIDIKQVQRCPRQLITVLSALFYNGTLIATPIHKFPIREFARAAGPRSTTSTRPRLVSRLAPKYNRKREPRFYSDHTTR